MGKSSKKKKKALASSSNTTMPSDANTNSALDADASKLSLDEQAPATTEPATGEIITDSHHVDFADASKLSSDEQAPATTKPATSEIITDYHRVDFDIPGQESDTSIEVLGRIFCVHSAQLRPYSTFFSRMNPTTVPTFVKKVLMAEKYDRTVAEIRYVYVSVPCLVPEGSHGSAWKLEEKDKWPNPNHNFPELNQQSQRLTFEKMLLAIYRREYTLANTDELVELVEMAKVYGALPSVSKSLANFVSKDMPALVKEIHTDRRLLLCAYQLRLPTLFKECFIYAVATQEGDETQQYSYGDKVLNEMVERGYLYLCKELLRIDKAIAEVERSICDEVERSICDGTQKEQPLPAGVYDQIKDFIKAHKEAMQSQKSPSKAEYYRRFINALKHEKVKEILEPIILPLLKSRLPWGLSGQDSGESTFWNRLLWTDISDEDLPWDKNATSWE